MPRKNMQDRLDTVWDELLDTDYGGLTGKSGSFNLLGRAFKFTDKGVKVATSDGDYAGVFVRDNGQGGIMPEGVSHDISGRFVDGSEVSVMLKGQITYGVAGGAIAVNDFLYPSTDGAWLPITDIQLASTWNANSATIANNAINHEYKRAVRARARTAAAASGDTFVLLLD